MAKNTDRDKRMAAYLKAHKIQRTTARCGNCYRIITIEVYSKGTKYTHVCYKG